MKRREQNRPVLDLAEIRPDIEAFQNEFQAFGRLAAASPRGFELDWKDRIPRLDDRTTPRGFEPHYTYHPAWAARALARLRPTKHIDISSSLSFGAMVSAFVSLVFYDYRPAQLELDNLTCKRADLTQLPFASNSTESLSCMHVIEHVGLGRYGDRLDPDGDLKAIAELRRVMAIGGSLLFVAPVGIPKVCFNAHRIYSYEQVAAYFHGFEVLEFALVDDAGRFELDADPERASRQRWGCGCWWFRK